MRQALAMGGRAGPLVSLHAHGTNMHLLQHPTRETLLIV